MRVQVNTPTFKDVVYNILDYGAQPKLNHNNK